MGSDEAVLFENADWQVTAAGLEHKANGYFIDRESLGGRRSDGFWLWPFHMLEKTWCAPRPFAEAFGRAVLAYGLADRDLADSFGAALRLREDPIMAIVHEAGAHPARPSESGRGGERLRRAGQAHPAPSHRAPVRDGMAIAI